MMSIVTRIELEGGVYSQPQWTGQRRGRVDALLRSLSIMAFDDVCAGAYSNILRATGFSRRRTLDRMIAAQAIVHRATLVTRNGADFRDIPGLTLLEW